MSRQASLLSFLCLLAFVFALFACSSLPQRSSSKNVPLAKGGQETMPRADPVYIQYLERQSMLSRSFEISKVVSGSELAWQTGAGGPDGLLGHADTWLLVHPQTVLTSSRSTVFSQLGTSQFMPVLREIGVRGLYVSPVQNGGRLWSENPQALKSDDDAVSYDFSRVAGDEAQYRHLMRGLIDNRVLFGSDLIPAATGLGPDFLLAVRNVREYPGIYCLVEIPEKLWGYLPDIGPEWGVAPLDSSGISALSGHGLLPIAMRDEAAPLARQGGWAATSRVRGVDGNIYRWIYRYYKSPEFAVLNWEDPSRAAHRILSGGAVRQVGLQGQAFIGLRFAPWQGLEAAPAGGEADLFSLEPARTASAVISREVRRYGGWAWVRDDDMTLEGLGGYIDTGVDFIFDSVFSPAVEHALLTGDAGLARFMADESMRLNIDMRRLVHAMPGQDGLNYALPHLAFLAAEPGGEKAAAYRRGLQAAMRAKASGMGTAPVQDERLYTTAAGLAALALDASSAEEAQGKVRMIEKGHSLLVFFRAMLPGMLMLAGQDLSGVLPLDPEVLFGMEGGNIASNANKGAYALDLSTEALAVSHLGMPRARQLYPAASAQVHQGDSFIRRIGAFLKVRSQAKIALGSLKERPETKEKGSIALLSRLPDNAWLLVVCNFSRKAVVEEIRLASVPDAALFRVSALGTGGEHAVSGKTATFSLGPWEGRALLLGGGASQVGVDKSKHKTVTPVPILPEDSATEAAPPEQGGAD